jgi:hypothetical protein
VPSREKTTALSYLLENENVQEMQNLPKPSIDKQRG